VVNVRVAALGRLPGITLPQLPAGAPEPAEAAYVATMQTCFDGETEVETVVWRRSALLAGNQVTGPAIIADVGATTILPPGFVCTVDAGGQLVIDVPLDDGVVPADTTAVVVGP
jgi:N-methylhydantoinase A